MLRDNFFHVAITRQTVEFDLISLDAVAKSWAWSYRLMKLPASFVRWQEEEAQILAVSQSPFQQSRQGTVEQHIEWKLALQGKVALDQNRSKEKAWTMVLESPTGTLSLSIGQCVFVYEEPARAKPACVKKLNPRLFVHSRSFPL